MCELCAVLLAPIKNHRPREIAKGFETGRNFPHCVGNVDGKHGHIEALADSWSLYYNYKVLFMGLQIYFNTYHVLEERMKWRNIRLFRVTYSIVLMAVVDSKSRFMATDAGAYGHQSDGGVFKASRIGQCLSQAALNCPPPNLLPSSHVIAASVFVGDEAFQLRSDFLRPCPGWYLSDYLKIFNYRLCRAR